MSRLRNSLSPNKLGLRKSKLESVKKGFYIYCIVDIDKSLKKFSREEICHGGEIYVIPYKDVGAAARRVNLSEFDGAALEGKLNDMEWVESNVRAHEEAIEKVMRSRTVIPFKFCTIFSTEARVIEMLEHGYHDFKRLLSRLKDKREWATKVYCNLQALKSALSKSSVKITELEEEISTKPAGTAYFLRKRTEDILSEEADRKMVEYAEEFYRKLEEYADDSRLSSLWSREMTGRDADMILNVTYLVDMKKEKDFFGIFQSLKKKHDVDGLEFECTGPWPPYNFVPSNLGVDSNG